METRIIIALVLITILMLALLFAAMRYARRRKQFKIRQQGRGKAAPVLEVHPAE